MKLDVSVYAAIAVMAMITFACRYGGYWIFAYVTPSPAMRRALAHLPGCIFAAYVVPAMIAGPSQNWIGAAATMAAMAKSKNLGVSIGVGVVAIFIIDQFLRIPI